MEQKITRIAVDSSMLSAVGYDENTNTLYLEFAKTGYIYAYYEVEKEIFEKLLTASSIGSYVHNNIFEKLLTASSIGSYVHNNIFDCYHCLQLNRKTFRW